MAKVTVKTYSGLGHLCDGNKALEKETAMTMARDLKRLTSLRVYIGDPNEVEVSPVAIRCGHCTERL